MEIVNKENWRINIKHLIQGIPFFSSFTKDEIEIVMNHLEMIRIEADEDLIIENTLADYTYFVCSGKLISYQERKGLVKVQGIISHGEVIGEMALISATTRATSVRAIRSSFLLRCANEILLKILKGNFQLITHIANIILDRTKKLMHFHAKEKFNENISTISLLACGGTPKIIVATLIDKIYPFLSAYQSIKLLTPEILGFPHVNQENLFMASKRIAEFESQFDVILLLCDINEFTWSELCIENSDAILYVAQENHDAELNALEKDLEEKLAKMPLKKKSFLFLKNKTGYTNSKIDSWLKKRNMDSILNACLHDQDSLKRTARILTKNSVSLVLSGGGANGYAHIGVFKALLEYKVPIDIVGGVSAGSVIAAFIAMGLDYDALLEQSLLLSHYFANRKFSDYQFPIASLIKPAFLDKLYEKIFADITIENLWLNYFCLACDLQNAKEVVFKRGLLKDAVEASGTIPGLFSPTLINGILYIDGGAMNTMPIDVAKNNFSGIVIGVNVSRTRSITIDPSYTHFPSSKEIILEKINFFSKKRKAPSLSEIINRSIVLANKNKLNLLKKEHDYIISPDLSTFGVRDYQALHTIIEIGYQETIKRLEEWGDTFYQKIEGNRSGLKNV